MLIIKSQIRNFISSTTFVFCLCNFQVSSELPHSEVVFHFFSFKYKMLPGREKKPHLCTDFRFDSKQVVQSHSIACSVAVQACLTWKVQGFL